MASSSQGLQTVLQVVLAIAILALSYFLYVSITEPYDAVERQKEVTAETRHRMDQVRVAMIQYQRVNGRYVTALDSLVSWVRSDSTMMSKPDSVFGMGFMIDSLAYSPRTGRMFILAVNDTSRTHTYLISDPDSRDHIGTVSGDVTDLNAASWE
jgi:type II secretory pathway pseudopilin PulG